MNQAVGQRGRDRSSKSSVYVYVRGDQGEEAARRSATVLVDQGEAGTHQQKGDDATKVLAMVHAFP